MMNNSPQQTNPLIDSNKELSSIINYISTTWDGFNDESSSDFFNKVWNSSNELFKNNFNQYSFTDFIKDFNALKNLDNITINGLNGKTFLMGFMVAKSELQNSLDYSLNYSNTVLSMIKSTKKDFPSILKSRPINWTKNLKNYSNDDNDDNSNITDFKKLFDGIDSSTSTSPSFEIRTTLSNVLYEYKERDRKPIEILISAIMGHSLVMNEKNNTSKILMELSSLKQHIENNPNQHITFEFKEPLNQTLFNIIQNNFIINNDTLKPLLLSNNNQKSLKP